MSISRKMKREADIQVRRTFRAAIKEQSVLKEFQERFKKGVEVGHNAATQQLLDVLKWDGILTDNLFDHYKELTRWRT